MAHTVTTLKGRRLTVSPKLCPVLGGVPEERVELKVAAGPMVLDDALTKADALMLGMALCAIAGDLAP